MSTLTPTPTLASETCNGYIAGCVATLLTTAGCGHGLTGRRPANDGGDELGGGGRANVDGGVDEYEDGDGNDDAEKPAGGLSLGR